jgi:probable DNA metabolism protein
LYVTFDGTFDGLLSAAAFCLRNGIRPQAVFSADEAANGHTLGERPIMDCEDIPCEANIRRLFDRHLGHVLGRTAGETILDIVYRAFLSELPGMADAICAFLRRALELRQDPSAHLHEPAVATVVEAAQKVSRQAQKFLGLLRFKEVCPGLLLADFEPDYHLLPLILPHFSDRLGARDFVIRDLRRHIAALHQANGTISLHVLADTEGTAAASWLSTNAGEPLLPARGHAHTALLGDGVQPAVLDGGAEHGWQEPAEMGEAVLQADAHLDEAAPADLSDAEFAALWRRYLHHLTIPERRNLALQQQFIPKKYWKYLVERPGGSGFADPGVMAP